MSLLPASVQMTFIIMLGLCVGSFLNVCIVRWPRGGSAISPRSCCPRCGHELAWWENIPLFSFLLLRGQCYVCRERISWQYPMVEIAAALLALLAWHRWGISPEFAMFYLGFLAPLLIVTAIDLEHLLIPDLITIPGTVLGVIVRFSLAAPGDRWLSAGEGVAGAALGAGLLWIVAWGYERLRAREGLGGGDVKLAAMLGAFLGWQSMGLVLLLAAVSGAVSGAVLLVCLRRSADHPIPFGPFLALAGVLQLFWGEQLMAWYAQLLHI